MGFWGFGVLGCLERRQGAQHRRGDLRLPPVVHDHAVALARQVLLGPVVGLGVEGFAGAGDEAQAGEVVLGGGRRPVAHPHADGSRGREHQVHAVPLAQLPGDLGAGVVGHALPAEHRGAAGEGAVDDEGVPHDPADVRSAPVDVPVGDLEEGPGQVGHSHQVPAGGVHDALGLAGGAGGVEDEQRILRVHGLWRAVDAVGLLAVVEVVLALGLESEGLVPGPGAPAVHDDVVDAETGPAPPRPRWA